MNNGYILESKLRETLVYTALGYSQRAIAAMLGITPKAVEKRLKEIYSMLGFPSKRGKHDRATNAGLYNHRCRAVWVGLAKGLITERELLARAEKLPPDNELTSLLEKHENATGRKQK